MTRMIALFLLMLLSYSELRAAELKCQFINGQQDKNSLVDFATSCEAAKSLAEDKEVLLEHKKNTLAKLSEKLAKQALQNSEELSLLTTFFHTSNQDLLMNSEDVKRSCKLSLLDNVESCNGKKGGEFRKEKIEMLKKHLSQSKGNRENNSISQILSNKYTSILLGVNYAEKTLQCPLNEDSSFALSAQLTVDSGDNIIRQIKSLSSKNADPELVQKIFYLYPQLKMIIEANKLKPEANILNKFIKYINTAPTGETNFNSKDYILECGRFLSSRKA